MRELWPAAIALLLAETAPGLRTMLVAIIALAVCIALASIGFLIHLGMKIKQSLGSN